LRERASEILAGWIVAFERSPLRFRRDAKASTHTAQVASLVEALTEAVVGGVEALRPGSDATRELERSAAFLGAQYASEGGTGFDIAALLLELRDVIASMATPSDAQRLTRVFEWLTVIALDAFAASGLHARASRSTTSSRAAPPCSRSCPKFRRCCWSVHPR
jgi:hypothetical protein